MSDPKLIADLVRAGVEPELIGRVSNALVNVRDNVRDTAVREYETGRKRRYRETVAAQSLSTPAKANDVAGNNADNVPQNVPDNGRRAPTFLPSLSLNLEGSTEVGSSVSKKARSENARARGQRMVAGAILTDEFRQAAIEFGAEPSDIPEMWAEFVDYWIGVPGQRGVKTVPIGWLATWRNRVREVLKRGKPRNGHAIGSAVSSAFDRLIARSESAEREAGGVAAQGDTDLFVEGR